MSEPQTDQKIARLVLPRDLGGFDQRFFGVEVNLASLEPHLVWPAIYPDETLAYETPFRWSDVSGDQDWVEFMSALSLQTHETQHAVDYFYSPWGGEVLRCRMLIASSLRPVMSDLLQSSKRSSGDGMSHIPVPYTKWRSLSLSARREQKHQWNEEQKIAGAPPINIPRSIFRAPVTSPKLQQGGLIDALWIGSEDLCVYAYDRLDHLRKSSQVWRRSQFISSGAVFEANAILCQIEMISCRLGQNRADDYLRAVLSSPITQHTIGLVSIYYAFQKHYDNVFPLRLAHAVVAWSLLGDVTTGDSGKHSPPQRLEFINEYGLSQVNIRELETFSMTSLFERWDIAYGVPAWSEAIRSNLASFQRVAERIDAVTLAVKVNFVDGSAHYGDDDHVKRAKAWSHAVVKRAELIASTILDEPRFLIAPFKLQQELEASSSLPILVQCGQGIGFDHLPKKFEERGGIVLSTVISEGHPESTLIWSVILPPKGRHCIAPLTSLMQRAQFMDSDLIFSEALWHSAEARSSGDFISFMERECNTRLLFIV